MRQTEIENKIKELESRIEKLENYWIGIDYAKEDKSIINEKLIDNPEIYKQKNNTPLKLETPDPSVQQRNKAEEIPDGPKKESKSKTKTDEEIEQETISKTQVI